MRLPQSFTRPLSVHWIHFSIICLMLALPVLAPVNAFGHPQQAQLSCSPSTIRFGKVDVGQSETLMATLTNSGLTSVTVSTVTINGSAFTTPGLTVPFTLAAGQSLDVNVLFTPVNEIWASATMKVSSNASNPNLVVEANGVGVTHEPVMAAPSALSFGQVSVGSASSQSLVITNLQNWKVTVTSLQTSIPAFTVSGPPFPMTLSVGQSVSVTVTFMPTSAGTVGGSVFLNGVGLSVPLTGTGTSNAAGQLSLSPASLNYGNIPDGSTDTLPLTISATGGSVTVSSASSSSSLFVLQGASFPVTIASGQSVAFNVAFTPKTSGTDSGSLSFSSNASNSPATESLTGVGTTVPYSVNLWWNPSSDVVGYNVYRSTSSSGSYSKINAALDANTAYTDSNVTSGNTYYYEATSVNSAGQESSLSTPPVQAVVP
jgi:Transmembrane protein 131-like N-terminal/Abnormal spindle-like microcephaly-assoc'd, ASPM-SPD-2-Hydin